jgi:lichenan operon transcriptional antiterminator
MRKEEKKIDSLHEKIIRGFIDVFGFVTVDDLSKIVGVSNSSIKHNLPDVKRELQHFDVKLLSVPKKGLCLDASKEERQTIKAYLENDQKNSDSFAYRNIYWMRCLITALITPFNCFLKSCS